jgi:hypothetical protein
MLNDALNATISMSIKLKAKINCPFVLDSLIDHDSSLNIKLGSLARNIKNLKFVESLIFSFPFRQDMMKEKLIIC